MIDYLELIRKEYITANFNFKVGILTIEFPKQIYYRKIVFHNSKKYKTLTDVNRAFEISYKNLQKLKDSNFIIKLSTFLSEYRIPKTSIYLTDSGIKNISTFIDNIENCSIDSSKVDRFKKDIFPIYKNYYDQYLSRVDSEIFAGNGKIRLSSMFNMNINGLTFYCRKPVNEFFDLESKYMCSLGLSSLFYCSNIFHEPDIKPRPQANFKLYEILFINYLYYVNGIDKIKSTFEYMLLNLDKKFPNPIISKHTLTDNFDRLFPI